MYSSKIKIIKHNIGIIIISEYSNNKILPTNLVTNICFKLGYTRGWNIVKEYFHIIVV